LSKLIVMFHTGVSSGASFFNEGVLPAEGFLH
jgi:hypothetical protein